MIKNISREDYNKAGAAILCIAALLLSGCFYPIQCTAILLLFGVLLFFVKTGAPGIGIWCALFCFAGFLISDLLSGKMNAPQEIMKYAFLFFPLFIASLEAKKSMLAGLSVGAVLLSVIAIAGILIPALPVGAGSLLEYENTMAVFACLGAAVMLYCAGTNPARRGWYGILFALCLAAVIAANSIFLYACIAAALAVVLCLRFKHAWYYVVGAVAAAGILLVGLFVMGKEELVLASTVASRLIYWQDALGLVMQHPFGIGVYGWENAQYAAQTASYSVKYVHNSILQLLLDGGVLAAAGYIGFVCYGIGKTIKQYRTNRDTYSLLLVFLLLVFALHALFDFDQAYGAHLLVIGVCISLSGRAVTRKFPTAAAALCVVALLGIFTQFYTVPEEEETGVMALTAQWQAAYDTKDYERAYGLAEELLTAAPRQQAAYDAAYLSIDKLEELGYSNKYEDAKEKLRQQAERVNASMHPLVKYLDRHQQIVLPAVE